MIIIINSSNHNHNNNITVCFQQYIWGKTITNSCFVCLNKYSTSIYRTSTTHTQNINNTYSQTTIRTRQTQNQKQNCHNTQTENKTKATAKHSIHKTKANANTTYYYELRVYCKTKPKVVFKQTLIVIHRT